MAYEADEEGMGEELTDAERDLIQQTRNSGLSPAEVLKRAQANATAGKSGGGQAGLSEAEAKRIADEAAKRATLAVDAELGRRDLQGVVSGVVNKYPQLSDAVDAEQVAAAAVASLKKRSDFTGMNFEATKKALAEEADKECKRRLGLKQSSEAEQKRVEAENRLNKEAAVVDGGGTGRSAGSSNDTEVPEDFDGSVCGAADDKTFAITDHDLHAAYSQKSKKFLEKERKKAV